MPETMIFLRRMVHVAVLALLVVPMTDVTGSARAVADSRDRRQADAGVLARRMLAHMRVARPLSIRGYSHRRFQPRWAHHKGACDAREVVLARSGRGVRRDAA